MKRQDSPRFHHVGFVVASIEKIAEPLERALGAERAGPVVHDPLQQARVAFLSTDGPGAAAVELVEADGETSHLRTHLERGGGLHHVCYEVDSLDSQLERSRSAGCLLVRRPAPAAAFGGRRIAWVYAPGGLLVEYLEREPE